MRITPLRFVIIIVLFSFIICNSSPPIWSEGTYFKAGVVSFAFTGSSNFQNVSLTYNTAITNNTLKLPTLGIINLGYTVVLKKVYVLVQVQSYSVTGLKFSVQVNQRTYLTSLQLRYMALDNIFTPAFSMNRFFPNINQNGTINKQLYVNFTASTGVILNSSNENVLLPFVHYIDLISYDSTIDIDLNFTVLNQSFYSVTYKSTSNMWLNYAGFSRLIFDKTAIEAMGNDYFSYGIIQSTNSNDALWSTTIPPDIITNNLYYGIHSFFISSTSNIAFSSSYNITSGFLGYSSGIGFSYTKIKFSYMHHKTRVCPAGYPYYNISEQLCYDQCSVRWYGSTSMICLPCLYDCYTCSNGTTCSSCNATTDYRSLSTNRCIPLAGYYENGSTQAQPCSSPCATCVTTASHCLSCITGYYLNGTNCLPCSSAITNCSDCSSSTYCTLCADGSSGNTCTSCTSAQYLDSSTSTCLSCSSAISNCQSCSNNVTCTLCSSTFTLYSATNCSCNSTQYIKSGVCSLCSSDIAYCNSCTSSNTCTSCMTTFTLNSPTNCSCNSTAYLDTPNSVCLSCSSAITYCSTCTSSSICTACLSGFTLNNATSCVCPTNQYADSSSSSCILCSSAISNCLTCSDNQTCTSCSSGYRVNTTNFQCYVEPCQVTNCNTCTANYSVCSVCDNGYSLISAATACSIICGDGELYQTSEECDDGNNDNGDGCSSTCNVETGFSCSPQYVSATHTFSLCFWTASISFSLNWIEKIEGKNSLKFCFTLDQIIEEWKNVNFTSILTIDNIDPNTNFSTGLGSSMISSFSTSYDSSKNRFYVILDYQNYDMQGSYLAFTLDPYQNGVYPAFTPPANVQFFPPIIDRNLQVLPNNNQNANLYSDSYYNLYSFSMVATYIILGVGLITVLTSLVFRVGKVITIEMVVLTQLSYFSLAFLDYMNPIFTGLLPLRWIVGILNFRGVEEYLQQSTAPSAMKGIYVFLNLSDNFSYVALAIGLFLCFGLLLLFLHFIVQWCANKDTVIERNASQKNGYFLYKLAFHFIGELSLSLIQACLPLFTISVFYEVFYTTKSSNFWSLAQGLGIGIAIIVYFIALIKESYPINDAYSKLGEYISQFSSVSIFKTLKYHNVQILLCIFNSGLIMLTISSSNSELSAFTIIFVAVIEIITIAAVRPYKYGFVSCFIGQDNDTEIPFQKIELYKVYKEAPKQNNGEIPNITNITEDVENPSNLFAQHFDRTKQIIKTKHQGLIQSGQILNHSKLYLFNNNFRKIFNLITIIVVEFIFICTKLYEDQINTAYKSLDIRMFLPFIIHFILFANVVYNYTMLILQILNRSKLGQIENQNEPQSADSLKSEVPNGKAKPEKKEASSELNTTFAKSNYKSTASFYESKRPQIISKNQFSIRKKGKRTSVNLKF